MKRKHLLFIAIVLLLATIATMLWKGLEPKNSAVDLTSATVKTPSGNASKVVGKSTQITQSTPSEEASNTSSIIDPAVAEKPLYQMVTTKSSFDPEANAVRKRQAPYKFYGSGGGSEGRIIDASGNVLMKTDPEKGIYMFGISVSKDNGRILISRGDAIFDIYTPSTGESIRLPQLPPGENVLGFSWHWIDDQTLLGVSGKTIPFRDDQVGPEREEPIISRSVLYLYDLKDQKISEVALPPALRTKTVSVSAVDEAGKVQLRPEGREVSYTDATLGWFEVRPKE